MPTAPTAPRKTIAVPLWSKQIDWLQLTTRVRGLVSGRNCGKSHVGCAAICLKAKKGDRVLVVSPDTNVIEETTWPLFESVARKMGKWIRGVRSPVHRAYIRGVDGGQATVVFRGAEKPDKLRGGNYSAIWFDECSVINYEAYKTAVGCARWKGELSPILMTFTPRGKRHWTFEIFFEPVPDEVAYGLPTAADFEDGFQLPVGQFSRGTALYQTNGEVCIQSRWYRTKENTGLIRARTRDNPFAPEHYADFLASQYTSEFAIQELEGLFIDVTGLMFRREWFTQNEFVRKAPRHCRRIRYWDLAGTEEGGCYTVGTLMGRDLQGKIYVEDVKKGRWSALERNQIILTTAHLDATMYADEVEIYVEQEPGSGGLEQSQQIVRLLSGYPVFRDLPTGGKKHWRTVDGMKVPGYAKIIRARPFSAQCEAGNVILVEAPWNSAWMDALCAFPHSTYVDETDSACSCFNRLASRDSGQPGQIEFRNPQDREPFGEQWRRAIHLSELARAGVN